MQANEIRHTSRTTSEQIRSKHTATETTKQKVGGNKGKGGETGTREGVWERKKNRSEQTSNKKNQVSADSQKIS